MKPESIPSVIRLEAWARPTTSLSSPKPGPADLYPTEVPGEYWLVQEGEAIPVTLSEPRARISLDRILAMNGARLVWIDVVNKRGAILLFVHAFAGDAIDVGDVQVGLGDALLEEAKRNLRHRDAAALANHLLTSCAFRREDGARQDCFFVFAGEHDPSVQPATLAQECFTLVGDGVWIPVRTRAKDTNSTVLEADRLVVASAQPTCRTVRLARGRLSFVDRSKAAELRSFAAQAMGRLMDGKDSYLRRWDEYGVVERDNLLSRAREVGALRAVGMQAKANGTRVAFAEPVPSELKVGDQLDVVTELPIYLAEKEMGWTEYKAHLDEKKEARQSSGGAGASAYPTCKVVEVSSRSVTLKDEPDLPEGALLVLSLSGDQIQIDRRNRARALILEGRSANPLLGMIIEDGSELPAARPLPGLVPLTPFVRNKIFRNEPTPTQVKAIEIALNTPDIAIIQGPPGTGKTTVISAIIERLNEEHDKASNVQGTILVTGLQHDAVENIIDRLSVNALPPVKFGKRQGETGGAHDAKIMQWCEDLAQRVRERNPAVRQSQEQRRIADAVQLYLASPSLVQALATLQLIAALPAHLLGNALSERTRDLFGALEEEAGELRVPSASQPLLALRALRVTSNGFRDDGPERAQAVLLACSDALDTASRTLLRRVVLWRDGDPLDFLDALAGLKEELIDLYSPRPQFRVEKPRNDVMELLAEVSARLETAERTWADPTSSILADFLHELECNPLGVVETVQDYNFVFAATCQQAEGKDIVRAKQPDGGRGPVQPVVYDTVIVDEAARVSPRDLLIPMAQGERRIILVGDHRQLPHIIDEKIARSLESGQADGVPQSAEEVAAAEKASLLEISMFEYLISRVKTMQEQDGIPRTVTLDAQYRMHPLLGRFISDHFYAPHGEAFGSPLTEDRFAHHLPGTGNAAAAWMDLPVSLGDAQRPSSSWLRACEAERIAECLAGWIDSEEGRGLTFGVISFYRAQVDALHEALAVHRNAAGDWSIAAPYRFLDKDARHATPEERLRIGTVDAFQGKEFDVVFLSMVRTLPRSLPHDMAEGKLAGRLFGHLRSPNRLCVSMSRQKRLLVVAGDGALLEHPLAEQAVPALRDFRRLCRGRGVLL